MDSRLLDWIAVAALGAIVGISELVSRYRDAPASALRSLPAVFYVALNAAASIAALGIIHSNPLWFPSRWTQVLMAGISAMAFFRCSLFIVRAGDRDVGIGPSGFLQIFLSASDRGVDRLRAESRSLCVRDIMNNVDYLKAFTALPPYCLALMQNVAPEDQQQLARALQVLDQSSVDPAVRSYLLGLELMNVVGVDVLGAAVTALKDKIEKAPPPVVPRP